MILSAIFGASTINLIILFTIVFFCAFGFPGGVLWLVASGAGANTPFELSLVMIVGASAAILGDFTAFMLARKFSLKLQKRLRKFKFYRNNETHVKLKFNKSEFFLLFFSRFLFQSLCAATTYVSGFLRLKIKKFLFAIVPGEIIYGMAFPLLGFLFKETWKDYTNIVSDIAALLLLIIFSYYFISWVIRYYKTRRKK
jgi:membrane protein DedA with SNARE-associated domain